MSTVFRDFYLELDHISTDFGVDSSSRFPRARTHAHRQTNLQTQLTPLTPRRARPPARVMKWNVDKLIFHDANTDTDIDSPNTATILRLDPREEVGAGVDVVECELYPRRQVVEPWVEWSVASARACVSVCLSVLFVCIA